MNDDQCEFCLYYEVCSFAEQKNDNYDGDCPNFIALDFPREKNGEDWEEMSYKLRIINDKK